MKTEENHCGNCKCYRKTDVENQVNPSGQCTLTNDPHEGWGIHAKQLACKWFEKEQQNEQ